MRPNLTIFSKGLILVSLPLLFLLIFAWLVADLQWQTAQSQGRSSHSKEVLAQTQAVWRNFLDAETGIRGFLLSDEASFRLPYDQAVKEVPEALARLRALVGDNQDQLRQAGAIAAGADEFMTWQAETDRLARNGQREQAVARIKDGAGKRLMDNLREKIGAFLNEERLLDDDRELALGRWQHRQRQLLFAGTGVALLGTVLLVVAFSRGVSGRVAHLTENVRRLARGDDLVGPLGGRDEIARLDHAFHDQARVIARSRAALREQAELLRSVLDSIGDGVIVADAAGHLLLFNPAAVRIHGKGPADVPPERWPAEYGLYLPDQRTPYPAGDLPLARALRGEEVDDVAVLIRGPGSSATTWTAVTARPLRAADGSLRGGVAVCRDFTERKRVEEAVRRLNEELERRVRERTAELAGINRALAQQNQENETFVYSVSHDLRSPLVNLQGFSRELTRACQELRPLLEGPGVPPAVRESGLALLDGAMARSIRFILTAVTRLGNIIDALLRLSRAGRVVYGRQPVDVQGVVGRVVEALKVTTAERGATIVVRKLPPARGDATALEQVFANLLGNALNYLQPGRPGLIEVGCREGTADLAAPHVYYVKDNGLGIAEAHREKVFQAFQRLHPEAAPGEGMGLAIVQRIVERHHGKVWVESVVGEGSTFFVSLPATT
jgi:signal transduction histidine kinase/CHASE3 domain sensor protein